VGFGWVNRHSDFWGDPKTAFWYLVSIPIGEEYLFRQWFYRVTQRLWGNRVFTLTNPFPAPVLLSSLAFSLWHLQNLVGATFAMVLFQVVYTFFTGLWLGVLRAETGRISLCIVAHFLINLASSLP
jgi:membrane protease YdiL (CAAX protease family)